MQSRGSNGTKYALQQTLSRFISNEIFESTYPDEEDNSKRLNTLRMLVYSGKGLFLVVFVTYGLHISDGNEV